MVDTALSAPTCFILLVFTGGHLHCLYSFVYTQSETELYQELCNLLQLLCLEWEVSDLWTQISGSGLRNLWFRLIVALIQI